MKCAAGRGTDNMRSRKQHKRPSLLAAHMIQQHQLEWLKQTALMPATGAAKF
jgi:hypothetical protein